MPMTYETAALQCRSELEAFIALLQKEEVKSYLEIGGKYGGSLWPIANALPIGSRVVCCDLPQGDTLRHLHECLAALRRKGYDTHQNEKEGKTGEAGDRRRADQEPEGRENRRGGRSQRRADQEPDPDVETGGFAQEA